MSRLARQVRRKPPRTGPRASLLALGGVAFLLAPTPARGDELKQPEPDLAARTAVRAVGSLEVLGPAGFGVEGSRTITAHLGVDGTLSYEDLEYGHNGVSVEALARYFPLEGPHALSVGLGPSLLGASQYGAVGFLRGEFAYEYRRARAVSVLIGIGAQVALNSSGTATCPQQGLFSCFIWTNHYSPGDVTYRLRLAVGAAF